MSEDKLSYENLCKSRQYIRARITRLSNTVERDRPSLSEQKCLDNIKLMNNLEHELNDINAQIHKVLPTNLDLNQLLLEEESYEEKISDTLQQLKSMVSHSEESEINSSPIQPSRLPPSNKLRLPDVALPEFSNTKSESLEKFLYEFESIISKHYLTEYEKFVYLKGQLRGGPLSLVKSLNSDEQTYTSAKELLTKAFASTLVQSYDAISRLTQLKLRPNDDVYEYISQMRSIISSFSSLSIDIDTVLQYFIWNSMNDNMQNQFINITNCSKPTLEEMNTHIFAATERYLKLREKEEDKRNKTSRWDNRGNSSYSENNKYSANVVQTNNLAVRVNEKNIIPCNLCLEDGRRSVSHPLINCRNYPRPIDKVKKLNEHKFCSLCSFKNHDKSKCRFKFSSQCKQCGGSHLTYLCIGEKISPARVTISNVTSVHFNVSVKKDAIILPTFTAVVGDSPKKQCRILQDTGSQRNFIREELARELNCQVIQKDVSLVIHGINSDRSILTNIVNIPVWVNDAKFSYEAIVVPNIDITISVPKMKMITEGFLRKGYVLADKLLQWEGNSDIANFDLVMGPDSLQLLLPITIEFGRTPNISIYSDTRLGVVLSGKPENILRNLEILPKVTKNHKQNSDEISSGDLTSIVVASQVSSSMVDMKIDSDEEITEYNLEKETVEALKKYTMNVMNYDENESEENDYLNDDIVQYILSNTDRTSNGRLIMPLPWNSLCKDRLGQNYNLSRKILMSNFKKLNRDNRIQLYDDVFREQENMGIIERIDNVAEYIKSNPDCSFLPHMGVFKMNRETTKVRIVYLSNLCEKKGNHVSHNSALLPGPCLNTKLSTSLLLSRFDKYILIFDIAKAFLGIQLPANDQNKLLCLWFRSVKDGDFSIIAFKNLRLSFGLRPSPTILMLALYRMLLLDIEGDDAETIELKKLIYSHMYMDNGMVSANDSERLKSYYERLPAIFGNYQFQLQQFATNDMKLQADIDVDMEKSADETVKFFGMEWNRKNDTFAPYPIQLDETANSKRKILSSLNSIYDLLNVYGPILNRAKLFFQKLQRLKALDWDTEIDSEAKNEWKKICRQANNTPSMSVPRFIGNRDSSYALVAFSDASISIYGVVVYLVEKITGNVSFILAKNRVINDKLSNKSIPTLECQGVTYAAEVITNTYEDLTSEKNMLPIKIEDLIIYTDSMVTLAWIRAYFITHEKMQKRSVYIMNRLKLIQEYCNKCPITFRYVEGRENPADFISRPISYFKLRGTNYLTGPRFLRSMDSQPDIQVKIPNADHDCEETSLLMTSTSEMEKDRQLINLENYSSLVKVANIYAKVMKFITILKEKVQRKKGLKNSEVSNFHTLGLNKIISSDQKRCFPDIYEFFQKRSVPVKNTPNLILQMNLYIDDNDMIRVKGKLKSNHPILLSDKSYLSNLIIMDIHKKCMHAGVFTTLREIRKKFWLLKGFVTVKKKLKECITCKKLNERPIHLNQSDYREFRFDPPAIPFSSVFIDYIGPVNVRVNQKIQKMWILIVTCLWSRAISLELLFSADTDEFLRGIQMHIHKYGLFKSCLSDLGSQLVAGSSIVTECLKKEKSFFDENNINIPTFQQYPKGNSKLGSLVENCVKQTKHLIIKSIGKVILTYQEFQLLICKTTSIINRRPIAFKQALQESVERGNGLDPITPEMLIYGRDRPTMDVIPALDVVSTDDPDFEPKEIRKTYEKLKQVNCKLSELYQTEFLGQLMYQSVDKKDNYKPVLHKKMEVGDIVLLVEQNMKRSNYPLGIVKSVEENSLGEVTAAKIFKGRTREIVYRHATSLILLLKSELTNSSEKPKKDSSYLPPQRLKRSCAISARRKIQDLMTNNLA